MTTLKSSAEKFQPKFRFNTLIRKNTDDLIMHCIMLGYSPEYESDFELNKQGRNIVCEYDRFHATGSDNKPHCIDCGDNECVFKILSAIKTTDIVFINTDGLFTTNSIEHVPEGMTPATDEEILRFLKVWK